MRTRSAPRRLSGTALVALILAAGCDADRTTIVLGVSGLTGEVRTLRVNASINGQQTRQEYQVAAQIGLRLPPGERGTGDVSVSALATSGCVIMGGHSKFQALGEYRIDVKVTLTALTTPLCETPPQDLANTPVDMSQVNDLTYIDLANKPPDQARPPDLTTVDLVLARDLAL